MGFDQSRVTFPTSSTAVARVLRVVRCRLLPEFIEAGEGALGRVGALVHQLPPANLSTLQARPHRALSRVRARCLTYFRILLVLRAPGAGRNRKGCEGKTVNAQAAPASAVYGASSCMTRSITRASRFAASAACHECSATVPTITTQNASMA